MRIDNRQGGIDQNMHVDEHLSADISSPQLMPPLGGIDTVDRGLDPFDLAS